MKRHIVLPVLPLTAQEYVLQVKCEYKLLLPINLYLNSMILLKFKVKILRTTNGILELGNFSFLNVI